MTTMNRRMSRVMILVSCVLFASVSVSGETLFQDEFEFFELGETWQEHEAGAPDLSLSVIVVDGAEILQMHSGNLEDEFRGIEMIEPISLAGFSSIIVDTRLRPINMGELGAVSSAEVAVIGSSGDFIRAFASNNAPYDPEFDNDYQNDWADHYEDSMDNIGHSGPWVHCPAPACDAMRNFVITVGPLGTTFQSFDDVEDLDDEDNLIPSYETTFDTFTLADLGDTITIALRHQTTMGYDEVIGWFDSITVTGQVGGIPGDYDESGMLDAADLDLQAQVAIGQLPFDAKFDENNDNVVDFADRAIWLGEIRKTWVGDSNLDDEFNTTDFVDVFTAGKYETGLEAGWVEGDWDGNLLFDTNDFVAAFTAGGYEKGPFNAGVAVVPEPSACVLLILAGLAGVVCRRR